MFIIGTGITPALFPPRKRYSGTLRDLAAACAVASDTARIALAPSLLLSSVPSSLHKSSSIFFVSSAFFPIRLSLITVFTFSTAFCTPLPRYLFLSLSLSSNASCSPVEAPLGAFPVPVRLSYSVTSASTVGLPLESSISLACTSLIASSIFTSLLMYF